MGNNPSSYSDWDEVPNPARGDVLVLKCLESPPVGYYLLTPGVSTFEEAERVGDFVENMELRAWSGVARLFEDSRSRPGVNGTFSVMDPAQRIYPIHDMADPVEIYFCHDIECPENPVLHGLKGTIVVLGKERKTTVKKKMQSMGNQIFQWILGESTPLQPPTVKSRRRVKILSFDEQGNVDIITTTEYNVVVQC